MSELLKKTVLEVRHWTDTLFSLKTTRNPGFRFNSGEFAMIGLEVEGRLLMRPYSLASAHYDEHLEFVSIKVPDGPLTSRLQHVKPGDSILVNRKTTGTLLIDNLLPGKNLWLLATGTGLAPFLSIVRDPEVYTCFDRVILTHTVRRMAELVCETRRYVNSPLTTISVRWPAKSWSIILRSRANRSAMPAGSAT
jgi:ferredoxin--NADP+ reductase